MRSLLMWYIGAICPGSDIFHRRLRARKRLYSWRVAWIKFSKIWIVCYTLSGARVRHTSVAWVHFSVERVAIEYNIGLWRREIMMNFDTNNNFKKGNWITIRSWVLFKTVAYIEKKYKIWNTYEHEEFVSFWKIL